MKLVSFSWVDYAFFVLMFGISILQGIYFGFFKKQNTVTDYLLGGRNMKIFPVSMSLVASFFSAVPLLGIPAEVYLYGTQYWMLTFAFLIIGVIMYFIFLPVFYNLQLLSLYEYLELRFDKTTRATASAFFAFSNFVLLPGNIYAPALAFSYVTGTEIYTISLVMSLICIFYTTIGGIKAVIWTDTLQFSVMLCTLLYVLIVGTSSVGGLTNIWQKASLGDRLEFFNMDPDPTIRSTFWSILVGNIFQWLLYNGIHPAAMQRFLAVPTFSDSKKVLVIFTTLTIFAKWISCFSGLIMFAKYFNCDPLSAGYISKADQILPYYVTDVAGDTPGVSGLFVAGLFSAALSTLSTYSNSLSGTIYEDFIHPFMPADISEKRASTVIKILTAVIGLISVGLVFVVEKLGTLIQMTTTLVAITDGPLLGVFILGVMFPSANKKGALYGLIASTIILGVIVVKSNIYEWNGIITTTPKPLSTHNCNITPTLTAYVDGSTTAVVTDNEIIAEEPHWLFRISFHYYSAIGTILTIMIGLLVSRITKNKSASVVNPDLLCTYVHRFNTKPGKSTNYKPVEVVLNELNINGAKEN